MTKEEIGNKPASEKTLREDLIGQALAGMNITRELSVYEYPNKIADSIACECIVYADAVIERLAKESEEGK